MNTNPYCYEHPRPALTVDIVLFRRHGGRDEVLLVRRAKEPFRGRWAFPGGFVDENEPLETAAARELREETSLEGIRLAQIGAYGDPGRDPRGHTVSIVFMGQLEARAAARAADDADETGWFPADSPPALAFDHDRILRDARALWERNAEGPR